MHTFLQSTENHTMLRNPVCKRKSNAFADRGWMPCPNCRLGKKQLWSTVWDMPILTDPNDVTTIDPMNCSEWHTLFRLFFCIREHNSGRRTYVSDKFPHMYTRHCFSQNALKSVVGLFLLYNSFSGRKAKTWTMRSQYWSASISVLWISNS